MASQEAFFLPAVRPRRDAGKIHVDTLFWGFVLAAGVYLSYLFAPLVWKKQELKNLAKEHAYQVARIGEDAARASIVSVAQRDLGIVLQPADIAIVRSEGSSLVRIHWRPVVRFVFGYQRAFPMPVSEKVIVF